MPRAHRRLAMPSPGRHRNSDERIARAGKTLETLERRLVMCALHQIEAPVELRPDLIGQQIVTDGPTESTADIVWTNRGQSSDGFAATFGANAETARRVIDAVIESFERMVGNFNYGDGSTNFNLFVTMDGNHNGASAGMDFSLGGKPKAGTITMGKGGNGLGSGWFIDPTPNEHSEFTGGIVNAFSGDAQSGSPAANLGDFYTVAAAEITHTLGLMGNTLSGWSSRTTNTGVIDNSEGGGRGTYWVFRGNSIKHLLTSNNGGPGGFNWGSAIHGAGPGQAVTFQGDTYTGSQDIGNATYEFGRRYIPNRAFALMFKDAYNYGTVDPSQFGTFYTMRDSATGQVNVRGTTGIDHISLSVNGSTLSVSFDPKVDVPGTGHLAGAGDVAAFVTQYDISEVNGLVINAGEGNDVLTVSGLPAGLAITLNAEGGNDTVNVLGVPAGATLNVFGGTGDETFAIGGGDVYNNIPGTLNLDGQGGTDTVLFDDSATTDNAEYTIDANGFVKTGFAPLAVSGAEGVGVKANAQANVIHVLATSDTRPVRIEAGAGDDTINVGNGLLASLASLVTVDGQAGNDTVNVDDSAANTNSLYFVNGNGVSRAGFGGLSLLNGETLRVTADAGDSIMVVDSTKPGVSIVLNGGAGSDTLTIEETNAASPVNIEGSAGGDTVNVNPDATGSAAVRFVSNVTQLGTLTIRDGGTATIVAGADKVVVVNGFLSMTPNAKFDLTDNALVVDHTGSSPIGNVRNLLASGYAGGAWNGNGINSSAAAGNPTQALGYAEASDVFSAFPATFAGVEVDSTAVLVRHTLYGDTNLDRNVNLTDFNRLAGNFGGGPNWFQGNFNYDATIGLADFNLLAGNFGATLASPATALVRPPTASAGVPEVVTVGTTRRTGKRTV